jgi:hypothetical protein
MAYADQFSFAQNTALINGNPNVRLVEVPRLGTGEERVSIIYDKIIQALTDAPTAKEKETGLYSPPPPPRVLFEGTSDEAQDFLQQSVLVETCRFCPIAKYTDGLPVIIPTEERVAEMLTGTSHKSTETLGRSYPAMVAAYQAEFPGDQVPRVLSPAGAQITFSRSYTATVEKVAICAVMAGCLPQHLPAALAIAEMGGSITNCPGTSSMVSTMYCVSGPYAKEIGMNAGHDATDVGNRSNMTLGRVGALISINFGQCTTGANRSDSGNPIHSTCFAEDSEGLPPGWEGLNEKSSHIAKDSTDGKTVVKYTKNDSIIMKVGGQSLLVGFGDAPASYRQLVTGEGALAWRIQDQLGIPRNTPGNYNPLMGIMDSVVMMNHKAPTSAGFLMHLDVALLLQRAGFKTKAEVYAWLTDIDNFSTTAYNYYMTGFWQHGTNNGAAIEPTSGRSYLDLALNEPDYRLNQFRSAIIIVADSFADDHVYAGIGRGGAYSIDAWR